MWKTEVMGIRWSGMWCGNFAEGEGGARYARSFRLATKFLHHRRAVEFLRSCGRKPRKPGSESTFAGRSFLSRGDHSKVDSDPGFPIVAHCEHKKARISAGFLIPSDRKAYLILPSLYITCLRTTGSYLLTSIFAGVFFLFLSVV